MGKLFLVSTPIGNLADITRRAAETLSSAGHLLAEDTRRTRKLLVSLGIERPLLSLHRHNEASREARVMAWLAAGESVALVSDAGTPLLSDPGAKLVDAAIREGHEVIPIPGASAILAALVAAGLPADRFTFLGFPPRKGQARSRFLARVAAAAETVVLFEAPPRVEALLADLITACGPERRAALARELTKVHETVVRGSLAELREHVMEAGVRGEVTLVVAARPPTDSESQEAKDVARILTEALLAVGVPPSRVAAEVNRRLGLSRNAAYKLAMECGELESGEEDR